MIWKNSIISFLVNQINLWIRFYEKVHKPVQQSWLKQKRCIKTQNKLIKKKKKSPFEHFGKKWLFEHLSKSRLFDFAPNLILKNIKTTVFALPKYIKIIHMGRVKAALGKDIW